jgi:hypothetical protein
MVYVIKLFNVYGLINLALNKYYGVLRAEFTLLNIDYLFVGL